MCAESNAKIGELKVDVYMGYYGGDMSVGDVSFNVNDEEPNLSEGRAAVKAALSKFSSEELAELVVALVAESEEG